MLYVPFYPNTADNTHCAQACLKMVLAYFEPGREYSYAELDILSGERPGLYTWLSTSLLRLSEMGYDIRDIDGFDIKQFVQTGEKYLIKKYGAEVARTQVDHSDIPYEQDCYRRYAELGIHEHRPAKWDDLERLIAEGYLVIVNLNYHALHRSTGYSGHMVVVYEITDSEVHLHDPGLPAHRSLVCTRDQFYQAWAYPDAKATNLTGIKKLRPR